MSIVLPFLAQVVHLVLTLAATPTLSGVLRWLNARFTGYAGPGVLQAWSDLASLLRKNGELPESASPLFRIAPAAAFGTTLAAAALVPSFSLGMAFAPLADLIAIAGLLTAGRVVVAVGALDSSTAPTGIAASQIMMRTILVEPGLWLVIFTLALLAGSSNLDLVVDLQLSGMLQPSAASALAAAALAGLVFAEIADPPGCESAEFSGHGLALIRAASALRLLVWFNLIGALFLPVGMAQLSSGPAGWLVGIASWAVRLTGFCVLLAALQSVVGRLRWRALPAFLGVTALLALLAAMLVLANTASA